jgi:hypothetical protein
MMRITVLCLLTAFLFGCGDKVRTTAIWVVTMGERLLS